MPVRTGIDVLVAQDFAPLKGKRVGAIVNPTSVDSQFRHLADLLMCAPGVTLAALFGPEHGIYGDVPAGDKVESRTDPRTGLTVHSLYGATRKPTPAMLQGLDALVYDLQDTGCRSYTFISTMGLAMEACRPAARSSTWMRENTCPGLTRRRAVPWRRRSKGERPGP